MAMLCSRRLRPSTSGSPDRSRVEIMANSRGFRYVQSFSLRAVTGRVIVTFHSPMLPREATMRNRQLGTGGVVALVAVLAAVAGGQAAGDAVIVTVAGTGT